MIPRILTVACLTVCATAAQAAVSLDLNLAVVRGLPEAAQVRARIDAVLPEGAKQRLVIMDKLFGFDPRRDLSRIVIEIPDEGLPSARLVGIPATAIATVLGRLSGGEGTPAGLTAYALPRRPEFALVALSESDMLIGHRAQIEQLTTKPSALGPIANQAVVVHLVPGPHPHLAAMSLVADAEIRASGTGKIAGTIHAKDVAAAQELERRISVLRDLVDQGAGKGLPALAEYGQILKTLVVVRHEATLEVNATVPTELRATMIERLMQRIEQRLHKAG